MPACPVLANEERVEIATYCRNGWAIRAERLFPWIDCRGSAAIIK
jgi:hypothetical protein